MKFLLKWIINGVIVITLLMLTGDNISFWSAAVTATILTIIAYVLGDLMILRMTNNIIATLCDALLAFIVLWAAAGFMDWEITAGQVTFTAIVLGFAEWFIHRYIFQPKAKLKQ